VSWQQRAVESVNTLPHRIHEVMLKGTTATAQDLLAHVAPQLTSYKRPSEIILLDALPATSSGKLLKYKMAELLRK
jgi:acyl-coenzyme A synthetase/AMP-(fatty) acid ligase